MSYYARQTQTHIDGTPIFQSKEDQQAEREVADAFEKAWECELHPFGPLAPVDWYAIQHGRLVGLLELKNRSHAAGEYPTVFLNVRKWLAMTLGASGLGVPSIFIVRFTDSIRYIPVADVDASRVRIAGCVRTVKANSDVEPVIEVPVSELQTL